MKVKYRYVIIMLILAVIFEVIGTSVINMCLSEMKRAEFDNEVRLLAAVKNSYPDVSEEELLKVLDGDGQDVQTRIMLQEYGITDRDWAVYENEANSSRTILCGTVILMLAQAAFIIVFLVYSARTKRSTDRLTNYLTYINSGNYLLMVNENTEDELSLLRNEIYKTTITLREQAERTVQDKHDLKDSISDISHQLKTPLTSMLIMLDEIIDDKEMPDDIRDEFLCDIRTGANTISFLVQSLLKLSRLEANSVEMKSENVNADMLFERCIENTAVIAELGGVCEEKKSGEEVYITCDEKWMTEALTNIVKNCIEHTPKGGKVTMCAEDMGLYKKLIISDNGCGIDNKDLPHIFERFYKGKNSGENSVGIGLALSKTIIEKQGGFISVESVPKEGSKFTIKCNFK